MNLFKGEVSGEGFFDVVRMVGRSIKDQDNPNQQIEIYFLANSMLKKR